MRDLIVVGGGLGGLALAGLTQSEGARVALCEAHTKLGGCAGYFDRDPFTFDVGATALMGTSPTGPIGALVENLGLDFQIAETPAYRVCLPDREFAITSDPDQFGLASDRVFPGRLRNKRLFWRLQEAIGERLFQVASKVPRLPLRAWGDLIHDLRALGPSGLLAASTWGLTVLDVLRLLGLDRDRPFRSLIAMLLQDAAQAGPETVPFANGAVCLQAYRRGLGRPVGGMKALAEGIGQRFIELGGELKRGTLVDRVETQADGFTVVTRRRERLPTRQVAFNLPIDLAARLLGRDLSGPLAKDEHKARPAWSAFTAYLAFRRDAIDDNASLFHQVLQDYDEPIHDGNNVLISLSPPGNTGYGPEDTRVATFSTHTRPTDWLDLRGDSYHEKKTQFAERMRKALSRALPGALEAIVHAEFASPRSFARYTRRTAGAVGGPPVARRNSNFLAVGPDVLGPRTWLVGDSVFPGQGTMAVVLGAIRVAELVLGRSPSLMDAMSGRTERIAWGLEAPLKR